GEGHGVTGVVNARPRATLADRLADAIATHGPMPSGDLARVVRVRKQTVQRELRTANRFRSTGRGKATRWELRGTAREPYLRHASTDPYLDVVLARLDDLAARVAAIEQMLATRDTSVDSALATTKGVTA